MMGAVDNMPDRGIVIPDPVRYLRGRAYGLDTWEPLVFHTSPACIVDTPFEQKGWRKIGRTTATLCIERT